MKIETAIEPAFQAHFVGAMGFPHSTEPSPWLERVITLPATDARERTGLAAATKPTRATEAQIVTRSAADRRRDRAPEIGAA